VEIKHTILAVDDTETNIDMLIAILKNYDVIPALSGEDAIEIAKNEDLDLILLDILMPGIDGFEVCKRLKNDPKTKEIPIIFITAKDDEATISQAYDLGGIDYVIKPFRPMELLARINTQLKTRELMKRLEFLASRDTMTGIYNRRKFFELGEEIFEKGDSSLYGAIMDIDKFKTINDTYGHNGGDIALKEIIKKIVEMIPSDTLFARMGGEEFGLLFYSDTKDSALNMLECIRNGVAKLDIDIDGNIINPTISIGVSNIGNCKNIDDMLKNSDVALYKAKDSGRNRVVMA